MSPENLLPVDNDGKGTYWVRFLFSDCYESMAGQHFLAGPYDQGMAEEMAERFGGVILKESVDFDAGDPPTKQDTGMTWD